LIGENDYVNCCNTLHFSRWYATYCKTIL